MIWVLESWADFEQVAMADRGAGVEKEFLAKSMSKPRQSARNVWVCDE